MMSRIHVCDFCKEPKFIGIRLLVRGSRKIFLPGMFSPIKENLELCEPCYDKMISYISKEKVGK